MAIDWIGLDWDSREMNVFISLEVNATVSGMVWSERICYRW